MPPASYWQTVFGKAIPPRMINPTRKSTVFRILHPLGLVLFGSFLFASQLGAQKPNIVLINLDDADSELMIDSNLAGRYPNLNRLAQSGLRFTNLHVTTPICGPSRACFLRCQYAHHTGIRINNPSSSKSNGFGGGMRTYLDAGYFDDDLSIWMKDCLMR